MGVHGAGFKLRMKLTSQKPGMILNLNDLNKLPAGGYAAHLAYAHYLSTHGSSSMSSMLFLNIFKINCF